MQAAFSIAAHQMLNLEFLWEKVNRGCRGTSSYRQYASFIKSKLEQTQPGAAKSTLFSHRQ